MTDPAGPSTLEWRDRALEAEARLAAVRTVLAELHAQLFADEGAVDRVEHVLEAPGPVIAPGQTWETRFEEPTRQAVILWQDGGDRSRRRPRPGETYWRIRAQRGSTIREDVLRRRWQLVQRAEATS